MKARKKPVIIDFCIWTGQNHREMFEFLGGDPKKYMEVSGDNFYIDHSKIEGGLVITTLEGEHLATIRDHIIKGVNGEFYPCKPDIFAKTYDIIPDKENYWDNRIPLMTE